MSRLGIRFRKGERLTAAKLNRAMAPPDIAGSDLVGLRQHDGTFGTHLNLNALLPRIPKLKRYHVVASAKDNYTTVREDAKDDTSGYQQFFLENNDDVEYNVFVHSDTHFGSTFHRLIGDLTFDHKDTLSITCAPTEAWPGNVTVRFCIRPVLTDWTPNGLTWNIAYVTDGGLSFGDELWWTLIAGLSTDDSPWSTELIKWPAQAAVEAMNGWDALSVIYGFELYIEVDATDATYAVTYNPTLADSAVSAYVISQD